MSAMAAEAITILSALDESEQRMALDYIKRLSVLRDERYEIARAAYWAKIDDAIEQLAQGRGVIHELVEVEDDE